MIEQQFEEAKKTEDRANQLQKQYENALKSAKEESISDCGTGETGSKNSGRTHCGGSRFRRISCLPKPGRYCAEREYAMRQMQGEIGKLAMEAAARIVGSQAGEEQDLSMYDQFIEKAGDPNDNGSC